VIRAVLFDLDDTLYDQRSWLAGAWQAVAGAAAAFGVAPVELAAALAEIAAEGSDRGRIIDRALERVRAAGVPVDPLVQAFRSHAPERLAAYPGVPAALARLRARCRVGLVTDGDPGIQRAKLRSPGTLRRLRRRRPLGRAGPGVPQTKPGSLPGCALRSWRGPPGGAVRR